MEEKTIGRPCPMKDCDGFLKRLEADIAITEYDYSRSRGRKCPKDVIGEPAREVYYGHFTRCEKCGFGAFQLNAAVAGPKG